jgi:putative endonuclease
MWGRLRHWFIPATTGDAGERLAAGFLGVKPGWRIVARNWRNPRNRRQELDLVACEGDILVIVEVKTRAAGSLVPGYYAVNRRKKAALRRAAKAYVGGLGVKPRTVRFDVVEVTLSREPGEPPRILHFEGVPLLGPWWRP